METLECVDMVVLCVAAAGEEAANLAAHVSRDWLRATKQVWHEGWTSGAEAAVSSLDRFRWAQSVGCPWRGRALLRAAARAGALDVLRVVARRYSVWDYGATIEAAEADHVHVVEWLERRGLLGPWYSELRAAGPRVREMARGWTTLNGGAVEHADPARHPARLADGAVRVEGGAAALEAALEAAQAAFATTGRPAQVEVQQLGAMIEIGGWRLVHGLRGLSGTRIVRVTAHARMWPGPVLHEALDPRRTWLINSPLQVEVERDPRVIGGRPLGVTYVGTWTDVPVHAEYDDGRFVYKNGHIWRACDVGDRPLERADGPDDSADLIRY
jgi:hypothetical protein